MKNENADIAEIANNIILSQICLLVRSIVSLIE